MDHAPKRACQAPVEGRSQSPDAVRLYRTSPRVLGFLIPGVGTLPRATAPKKWSLRKTRYGSIRALCAETHDAWLEGPPIPEHGLLQEVEEGPAADGVLNEHGLNHDRHVAQFDVHNLRTRPGPTLHTL